VNDELAPIEVSAESAREAVVALAELRGWAVASPRKQMDFMLPRIDAALRAFHVDKIVARVHGDVLEGRPNSGAAE
jgi:hypothetical protein